MAKAKEEDKKKAETEGGGEASPPPKKKGKLPLIVGLVVALAGGGGGAWYFMSGGNTAQQPVKAAPPKPPVFVSLDTFTVNLTLESNEQYLQANATLKVLDSSVGDMVKQYMPEIRHRILLLLASKKTSEISSGIGREQLSEEIRQVTNNILLAASGKTPKPLSGGAAEGSGPPDEAKPEGEPAAEAKPEGEPAAEAKPEGEPAPPAAAPAPAPAEAKPAGLVRAAPDDPVQSVFFTSFIIQ